VAWLVVLTAAALGIAAAVAAPRLLAWTGPRSALKI
jgi:hypothetical protein